MKPTADRHQAATIANALSSDFDGIMFFFLFSFINLSGVHPQLKDTSTKLNISSNVPHGSIIFTACHCFSQGDKFSNHIKPEGSSKGNGNSRQN